MGYIISISAKCCITSSTAGGCKELQCVFLRLLSGLRVLCVWCFEMVGLSVAAAAGSTVALIMQVLQVLGGKKKRTFLCLDHRAQRDCMLKQSKKLIGYTYLVRLCLFGSLFFPPFLPLREEIFL